jgi:hypothetical protein
VGLAGIGVSELPPQPPSKQRGAAQRPCTSASRAPGPAAPRTRKGEEDDEAVEEDAEDLPLHVGPAVGPLLVVVPVPGGFL